MLAKKIPIFKYLFANKYSMKDIGMILKKLAKQQGITMLGQFRKLPKWQILISTILSASAPDRATIPVSKKLFKKYNSLQKLADADPEEVKKIIKPCVYFNNKAKYIMESARIILEEYKGKVPSDLKELMKLPGVGHKVANCVLVYGFDKPGIPVDTHVAKIALRLGWTEETDPKKVWRDLEDKIPKKYWPLSNELFVLHGQNICFKRNPKCDVCSVSKYCNHYKERLLTS